MKKLFGLMICIVLLSGCAKKSREIVINIDRDFEYIPKGWPLGLSPRQPSAPSLKTIPQSLKTTPHELLSKEPEYESEEVLYGFLTLGNAEDDEFTFVLDDLESETWIVHFDKNNNEDLTDDGVPLKNQGTGKFATILSLEVPVLLQSGERLSRQYKLWFWIKERDDGKYLKFYSRCHYRKDLRIGKQEYTAIVYEMFNHDALYQQSGIWIDLDRDGKLNEKKEHFADGSTIVVDGRDYVIVLNYP